MSALDFIPPGHGEPEPGTPRSGGSNVRTDSDWQGVLDSPAYIPEPEEIPWP